MSFDVSLPGLHDWLPRQRWYSAKGHPIQRLRIDGSAGLGVEGPWLVQVTTTHSTSQPDIRWLLCLAAVPPGHRAAIGLVDGQHVADIADEPTAAAAITSLIDLDGQPFSTPELPVKVITGRRRSATPQGDARVIQGEQSNTSIVLGSSRIIKVIRRLHPGPNPEVELTSALTEAGVFGIPALHGAVIGPDDTLMVLESAFIANTDDGWQLALAEARGDADNGLLRRDETGGMFGLGQMIRDVHDGLALLGTDPISDRRGELRRLGRRLRADAADTLEALEKAGASSLDAVGAAIRERLDQVLAGLAADRTAPPALQRVHGDLHLGQVLRDPEHNWWVTDFEGEPGRPMDHRRAAAVPAVDLAGMVRSIDYVAETAVRDGADRGRARGWAAYATAEFVAGYGMAVDNPWLRVMTMDKLLYELRYEAANRPSWLSLPLAAMDSWLPSRTRHMPTATDDPTTPDPRPGPASTDDENASSPMDTPEPDLPPPDPEAEATPRAGTLGDMDVHLLGEGRHEQAWTVLGANRRTVDGVDGVAFAVWAPNARQVRVIGDHNAWNPGDGVMSPIGDRGIWECFVPGLGDGAHYKFEVQTSDGRYVQHADPWAKHTEVPPSTASRVFTSTHEWRNPKVDGQTLHGPVTIYEVHAGSWQWTTDSDGHRRPMTYRELAHALGGYLVDMGFTHVEFMPVAEHPFGGSWGYQVTGHFAPTSRFGSPDDFRHLVDHLHGLGIGVIVDWVPAHFPKDEWALARFDGTALYEHDDPRQGEHPDWGTLVFNYGRTEVRNFLLASALFWLEELQVDGLRVDAVASMLYLDYSREEGQWVPNEYGGRENLRAVELLQEVNATAYKRNPHVMMVAEESTAWPGVSRPTHLGGLGFGFKWNMGWMNDTLAYFSRDPIHRRWHHNEMTFGLMYAWSEHFVLPLSHDEVVHGKGSLLGKMPGDRWQQLANLRSLFGWMWGHPGKKLLFMGGEIAQEREWSEERELDWGLIHDDGHAGVQALVRDLNHNYRALPALWRRDDDPDGFQWIDPHNSQDNLLSFVRWGAEGDPPVAVVANLSPVPRHSYRLGLPRPGLWREALNSDSERYGGSNVGNLGGVVADGPAMHGCAQSAEMSIPPLGVVWFVAEP